MGSREGVAARIDADTRVKIDQMNKAVSVQKDPVSLNTIVKNIHILHQIYIYIQFFQVMYEILKLVYDIKPELHKNYRKE